MDIFKTLKKEKFYYIALALLFLLGFCLRLKILLLDICFQSDEIWIIENFREGYLRLFLPLDNNQIVPVGFLMIEKFLYGISTQDMFLKLQAFSWGMLALAFFPVFAQRFLKNKYVILMSYFMFAIHFPIIVYTTVAKSYITDVFFAMLIITLFTLIDIKKDSTKKLLAIGLISAIGFWFSFTSIFVFVSSLIAFVIYNYKDIKNSKFYYLLIPVGISLFLYVLWGINIYNAHYAFMLNWWYTVEKTVGEYNFLEQIQKEFNLISLFSAYNISKITKYAIYGLLLFIGFLVSKGKKSLYILLPIFTMIVCHLLKIYPMHLRLTLYIAPIYILFLFMPFENVSKKVSKAIILLCIILLLINQITYLYSDSSFIKLMNRNWIQGNSCTDEREFASLLKQSEYYNENDRIYVLFNLTEAFLPDSYVYHLNKANIKNQKTIIDFQYEELLKEIKKQDACWLILTSDYAAQIKNEKFVQIIEEYTHESYAKFDDRLLYVKIKH